MKKFFSHKYTVLSLFLLTIVTTILYIIMLTRPVSTIGTYKFVKDDNTEYTINFDSKKYYHSTKIKGLIVEGDSWYFVDGNTIVPFDLDPEKEDYDERVDEIKKSWDYDIILSMYGFEASAFQLDMYGSKYENIVIKILAVVGVGVELLLISLTGYSVSLAVKKSKKKSKKR